MIFYSFSICVFLVTESLSHVQLSVAPLTVALQAPLFMKISKQEYLIRLPFPPSEDLPHLEIEPVFSYVSVLAGGVFTTSTTCEA